MEILGPAGRYVDPVFQDSQRHIVDFVWDLVQAGSIGIVEDAVEHFGLLFAVKKAGAQRFTIDARASNRHFLKTSIWSAAHRRKTLTCRISRSGQGHS